MNGDHVECATAIEAGLQCAVRCHSFSAGAASEMSKIGGSDSKNDLHCSFCGKSQNDDRKTGARGLRSIRLKDEPKRHRAGARSYPFLLLEARLNEARKVEWANMQELLPTESYQFVNLTRFRRKRRPVALPPREWGGSSFSKTFSSYLQSRSD